MWHSTTSRSLWLWFGSIAHEYVGRTLLNKAFLLVKLKSPPWLGWSLWNIYVINDHEYVSLVVNTSRSFSPSCLIAGFVFRLTHGATSGAGTAYPSLAPEFTPGFQLVSCYSIFSFMRMFRRSLFVLFLLVIVQLFAILWFTDSDYPFDIDKLFLWPRNRRTNFLFI